MVFTTGSGGGTGGPVAFDKVVGVATGASFTHRGRGTGRPALRGHARRLHLPVPDQRRRHARHADGHRHGAGHATARGLAGAPARTIIGMAFDPASTAAAPILWITDNYQYVGPLNVPDWSSRIGTLSGADLGTYTSEVVGPAALGQGPRDQLARVRPGRRALPHPGRQQRHGRGRLARGATGPSTCSTPRCCGSTRPEAARDHCRWTCRPRRAAPTTRTPRARR